MSPGGESSHYFESDVAGNIVGDTNGAILGAEQTPGPHGKGKPPFHLKSNRLTLSSNDVADFVVLSVELNQLVTSCRLSSIGKMVCDSEPAGALKFVFHRQVEPGTAQDGSTEESRLLYSALIFMVPNPTSRRSLLSWFSQCTGLTWETGNVFPQRPAEANGNVAEKVNDASNLMPSSEKADDEWHDPIDDAPSRLQKADESRLPARGGFGDNQISSSPKEVDSYGDRAEVKQPNRRPRSRAGKSKPQANVYGLRSTPVKTSYGMAPVQAQGANNERGRSVVARDYNDHDPGNVPRDINPGPLRKAKPTNIYSHLAAAPPEGPTTSAPQPPPAPVLTNGARRNSGQRQQTRQSFTQVNEEMQQTFPETRPRPIQRAKSQPPLQGRSRKATSIVSGDIYEYTRVCRLFYGYDLDTITIVTLRVRNPACSASKHVPPSHLTLVVCPFFPMRAHLG